MDKFLDFAICESQSGQRFGPFVETVANDCPFLLSVVGSATFPTAEK